MEEDMDYCEPVSLVDKYRTQAFTYHGMEMYSLSWNHFEKCRQEKKFTDIIVQVENQSFPCHKILLDACCPYFSALFSFASPKDQKVIELKGVSLAGFTKLLDFMYTATLTVSAEEVIDVLECADFLQLRDLVHACSGFLFQHINSETCLKIFQLAEAHLLADLREASWQYIQDHFEEISQHESFLHCPQDMLVKIIKSRTLKIDNERSIFKSVISWVLFSPTVRKDDLKNVISHISVTKADIDSLSLVDKDLSECFQTYAIKTATERCTKVMVVVSRDTNQNSYSTNDIFYYNPKTLRWKTLTAFPFQKRHHFGVAMVRNKLYLTGGVTSEVPLYDKQKLIFEETWEYDILTDKWQKMKLMNGARYNHSSASLQDLVYVVGGRGNRKVTVRPDGEVYNPSTDQWTNLPCIREVQGIGNASLTALDGKLYLIGGMHSYVASGRRDVSFDSYKGAQYYDPIDNDWHELHDLAAQIESNDLRLSRNDCVAYDGFLFLLQEEPGKRMKIYNPVSKSVHDFILSHGYHKFAASAVHDGRLVMTGGLEEKFKSHDMVHSLDLSGPPTNWKMMCPLPTSLSHHTCFSVYVDLMAIERKEKESIDSAEEIG